MSRLPKQADVPRAGLAETVRRILRLVRGTDRTRLWGLVLMMLFAAVLEAFGIGLVVPLLVAMTSTEATDQGGIMGRLIAWGTGDAGLTVFAGALLGVFVVKNGFLSFLTWARARYQLSLQVKTSRRLLGAYLGRTFEEHVQSNTAETLRNVNDEVRWTFQQSLGSLLNVLTEGLVVVALIALLVAVNPIVAISAVVSVGGLGALFFLGIRRRTARLGEQQQRAQGQLNRVVAQSLGSFKETRLLGTAPFFLDRFEDASRAWADTYVNLTTVKALPRYVLETLSVVGMLVVVIVARVQGTPTEAIVPLLTVVALASVRLAPSATRIISSLTVMVHYSPSVRAVIQGLDSVPDADDTSHPTPAERGPVGAIEIDGVSFTHAGASRPTLSDVHLQIAPGTIVAFVGSSGAGKSTLADVILGLLAPAKGSVRVAGRDIADDMDAWQRSIGYVPQQVYLVDDTVRRNVAFGVVDETIEDDRVWAVLEHARIADFVREQPGGLDAIVGENGVRISGGQRQRLGIARALYHEPDVLVLDEATSALDARTEQQVTETILGLRSELTIIVIAHRLSTVRECDQLFLLRQGHLIASGTFDELLASDDEFASMVRHAGDDVDAPGRASTANAPG